MMKKLGWTCLAHAALAIVAAVLIGDAPAARELRPDVVLPAFSVLFGILGSILLGLAHGGR